MVICRICEATTTTHLAKNESNVAVDVSARLPQPPAKNSRWKEDEDDEFDDDGADDNDGVNDDDWTCWFMVVSIYCITFSMNPFYCVIYILLVYCCLYDVA